MKLLQTTFFYSILFLFGCAHKPESKILLTEIAEYNLKGKYQALYYLSQTVADNRETDDPQIHFIELIQKKKIVLDLKSSNILDDQFDGQGLREVSYLNLTGDSVYSFINEFSAIVLKDSNGTIVNSYEIPLQYSPFPNTKFFFASGQKRDDSCQYK